MKKKNLNRAVTVALAGLMLVNPVTAFAANNGQGDGEASGSGSVPSISDSYFNMILPTSATKDNMLDFRIDPQGRYAEGKTILHEQVVPTGLTDDTRWTEKNQIKKVTAESSFFKPGATIYFKRVDYANIPMGRTETEKKKTAKDYFGDVRNIKLESGTYNGKTYNDEFVFSDTSNWIVAVNKSSVPVSVKLEVEWPQHEGISIIQDPTKLDDKKAPQIYMAVEMTDGYTGKIGAYDVVGENYVQDKEGNDWLALNGEVSKPRPTQSEGNVWYEYMRTENQFYLGKLGDDYIGAFDSSITDLKKYPFYREQVGNTSKLTLKDNTETYDGLKNVNNVWPTYGFRLTGAANRSDGWGSVTNNPQIRLIWRIETKDANPKDQRPYFAPNKEAAYQLDLDGVMDDKQGVVVVHGTGEFKSTKITRVEWEMDGTWYDILDKGHQAAPDHELTNDLSFVTVDDIYKLDENGAIVKDENGKNVVDTSRQFVHIRLLSLMNWADHGYLKDSDDVITLKIYFETYDEPLTLNIVDHNADQ